MNPTETHYCSQVSLIDSVLCVWWTEANELSGGMKMTSWNWLCFIELAVLFGLISCVEKNSFPAYFFFLIKHFFELLPIVYYFVLYKDSI